MYGMVCIAIAKDKPTKTADGDSETSIRLAVADTLRGLPDGV